MYKVSTNGNFNTAEKTGGSETHTLAVAQMPSQTHTQNSHRHNYRRPTLFGGEDNYDGSIFTPRYSVKTSSQYKGNSNDGLDGNIIYYSNKPKHRRQRNA